MPEMVSREEIAEGLKAVLTHPFISKEKKAAFQALCTTAFAYWDMMENTPPADTPDPIDC